MQYQSIIIQTNEPKAEKVDLSECIPDYNKHFKAEFFNTLILSPEKQSYNVKEIQELVDWNSKKPAYSSRKMAIIENAEELTVITQNKLLKTLEEPAENTIIVLLTSRVASLIDTVISRCKVYIKDSKTIINNNEIIDEFIKQKSFNKRLELIEEIINNGSSELVIQIIKRITEKAINESDKEKLDLMLHFFELHRKNKLNIRLTLESLAIMLE